MDTLDYGLLRQSGNYGRWSRARRTVMTTGAAYRRVQAASEVRGLRLTRGFAICPRQFEQHRPLDYRFRLEAKVNRRGPNTVDRNTLRRVAQCILTAELALMTRVADDRRFQRRGE